MLLHPQQRASLHCLNEAGSASEACCVISLPVKVCPNIFHLRTMDTRAKQDTKYSKHLLLTPGICAVHDKPKTILCVTLAWSGTLRELPVLLTHSAEPSPDQVATILQDTI